MADDEHSRDKRVLGYVGAIAAAIIVVAGEQIIDNRGAVRELMDSRDLFRKRFELTRQELKDAQEDIARLQERIKALEGKRADP